MKDRPAYHSPRPLTNTEWGRLEKGDLIYSLNGHGVVTAYSFERILPGVLNATLVALCSARLYWKPSRFGGSWRIDWPAVLAAYDEAMIRSLGE